jgi:hypothetical protein
MWLLRKTINVLAGHDLFCARDGDGAGMRCPLAQKYRGKDSCSSPIGECFWCRHVTEAPKGIAMLLRDTNFSHTRCRG